METALRGAVCIGGMMADENAKLGAAYPESTRKIMLPVTSSQMVSVFHPWKSWLAHQWVMVAFAFCFPYSVGGPDLKSQPRDRPKASPVVDFETAWSALMSERVEGQFQRDSIFCLLFGI